MVKHDKNSLRYLHFRYRINKLTGGEVLCAAKRRQNCFGTKGTPRSQKLSFRRMKLVLVNNPRKNAKKTKRRLVAMIQPFPSNMSLQRAFNAFKDAHPFLCES